MRSNKTKKPPLAKARLVDNNATCHMCFRSSRGHSLVTLRGKPVPLHMVRRLAPFALVPSSGLLRCEVLVANVCGVHMVCGGCLAQVSRTSHWDPTHCISMAAERCAAHPDAAMVRTIEKLAGVFVSNADKRQRERLALTCTLPRLQTTSASDDAPKCRGRLALDDTQTAYCCSRCRRVSCLQCKSELLSPDRGCMVCYVSARGTRLSVPSALFPFITRQPAERARLVEQEAVPEAIAHLYRNSELTAALIAETTYDIIASDFLYVRCAVCNVPIEKSQDCNEISHCGVTRCYFCGITTTKGASGIGGDHWTPHDDPLCRSRCPRFDSSAYIRKAIPTYLCADGVCHDLDKDCHDPRHATGIVEYNRLRKLFHLRMLVLATPDHLAVEAFEIVVARVAANIRVDIETPSRHRATLNTHDPNVITTWRAADIYRMLSFAQSGKIH
jgi:hypothetical protein